MRRRPIATRQAVRAITLAAWLGVCNITGALAQERIRPAYTADYVAQMLDYVSRDYALAVSKGQVIDDDEYAEQLVVSNAALTVSAHIKALAAQPSIRNGIIQLIDQIKAKAPPETIKRQALGVRNDIFAAAGVSTSPRHWPDLVRGQQIYALHCASCHGRLGDGRGPAAQGLTPAPANFLNAARMSPLSPLSVFGAAKLGIRNTAMPGFAGQLSEDELWAVSFFVLSLPAREAGPVSGQLDQTAADLWLKAAAHMPDEELMHALPGTPAEQQKLLALIRRHPGRPPPAAP